MTHSSPPNRCTWDTACAGQPADVSMQELSRLGDHLQHCGALRGPLDSLLTGALWLQAVVAEHVVTAAVVVTLLVGAVSLAL
jgi:hypothetical protein